MNVLSVETIALGTNLFRCFFSKNSLIPSSLALDVIFPEGALSSKSVAIAELCALRHLMSEMSIIGSNRWHGKGIILRTRHREFKKLAVQEMTVADGDLFLFGQFLQTRYLGIEIKGLDESLQSIFSGQVVDTITAAPVIEALPSRFGPIQLSYHGLTRLAERASLPDISSATSVLGRWLQTKNLHPMRVVAKHQAYYLRTHGFLPLVLFHKGSGLNLIIDDRDDKMRLVTVSGMFDELYYDRLTYDHELAQKGAK